MNNPFNYAKYLPHLARLCQDFPWIARFLWQFKMPPTPVQVHQTDGAPNPDLLFSKDGLTDRLWLILKEDGLDGWGNEQVRVIEYLPDFGRSGQSERLSFLILDALTELKIPDEKVLAFGVQYNYSCPFKDIFFYLFEKCPVSRFLGGAREYREQHPNGYC